MKNYVQEGKLLEFTAPAGGVTKGVGLHIGSLFFVPTVTAAQTVKFVGLVEGVVEHNKTAAQAWTEGVKIYFITATSLMTTAAGGNTLVGVASVAAANPSSTGFVRIDGVAR